MQQPVKKLRPISKYRRSTSKGLTHEAHRCTNVDGSTAIELTQGATDQRSKNRTLTGDMSNREASTTTKSLTKLKRPTPSVATKSVVLKCSWICCCMPDYNQIRRDRESHIEPSTHIEGEGNITEGLIVSPRAIEPTK